ncbi:MAG: hypothetical protein M3Z64_10980 [Verrucomicrobiota bacterium]|nr:hypothetical protein [Verrucomicrobiota bacterium]
MRPVVLAGIVAVLFSSGCRTAEKVAVTSFRVIDTPAAYVRRHLDTGEQTTTTTTVTSDRVTPGHAVEVAPPPPPPRRIAAEARTTTQRPVTTATPRPSPRPSDQSVVARSSAAPSARNAGSQSAQFPTAKPVPGKPGYVFSPFDPSGGYVDVSGYPSGSKAKDPYSQKVFIVP